MADLGIGEFTASAQGGLVRVRAPEAGRLRDLLSAPGVTVSSAAEGVLTVRGSSSEDVGEIARAHGIAVHELVPEAATLEEAFMELTVGAVEYRGSAA
jgi:ABC-2 type transport system ATP-binding protein